MPIASFRPVMLSPARIGDISPCDLFDGNGNLLLRRGALISENVQKQLGSRRLFCTSAAAASFSMKDPLRALIDAGAALNRLDAKAGKGRKPDAAACRELAEVIHESWRLDPDACIGYARIANPGTPSVCQALLAALFAAELGSAHTFTRHELVDLIGAALTMNIGSMALHDEMAALAGPLPTSLRRPLAEHPRHAAELLNDVGISKTWSRAVLEHHENLNGSGYPRGLAKGGICLEARMLRLIDIFAARLRVRRGRGPQYWSISRARDIAGLTEHIFGADLDSLDLSLARLLMGRLGLFPPGSVVRLSNGEMAIINRRFYDLVRDATLAPREVLSFLDASGRARAEPCLRRIGPHDYRILGYAHDDQPRLPAYDWPSIWGYQAPGGTASV
ncbi:MAG: HD domain-containing protein [Azoarcus sp.]|nr:HD domain-containing protein [Azoarcus sp.]